jgi:hypothetical protein
MKEKVIEDLVHAYPDEFFNEPLKFVGRQIHLEGRRLDILFEDESERLLLVELKRGEIKREHVGQAGEYFGLLRVAYPDRETRVALLGTAVSQERKRFLEAFGVEVHTFSEEYLLRVAEKHGVNPETGIARELESLRVRSPGGKTDEHVFVGDRFPVTDEKSYFELIDQLDDESAKERLVALYGAAKSSACIQISFNERGTAEFLIQNAAGESAKLLKVGISFKSSPPKATITFYWKYMLEVFAPELLREFAELMDRLLERDRVGVFLDPSEKSGTFDTVDLHRELTDDADYAQCVRGIRELAERLSRA